MIRFVLILLLLASNAQAAITRIQSAAGSTGSANGTVSTFTITMSALTTGNFLLVALSCNAARSVTISPGSLYDLVGGTVTNKRNATSSLTTYLNLYRIKSGGGTSIVVTNIDNTNSIMSGIAIEYSATNLDPDVWRDASATSATPDSGTTVTSTFANELQIGVLTAVGQFSSAQTAWATSPTNSFTSVRQNSTNVNVANADRAVAVFEKFVTSTGTANVSATNANGSAGYAGMICTFSEITGGGGVYSSMGGQ